MNLDFTNDAKQFELNNDFLDTPGMDGKQRRVNLIRMAMEHGAKVAVTAAVQNIRKNRVEMVNQRVISNGHQDSGIFNKK